MIDWSTVKGWVQTWIDMINAAFDDAIATLTVSPFDSRITCYRYSNDRRGGRGSCVGINVLCHTAVQ